VKCSCFFCEIFFSNLLNFNQVLPLFQNIRQTRKETNDHTTPNEDNILFPFQPTSSLVAAVHDLQLFKGLSGAGAPVLGYFKVSPMDSKLSKTKKIVAWAGSRVVGRHVTRAVAWAGLRPSTVCGLKMCFPN
jgi:hypothetical protein